MTLSIRHRPIVDAAIAGDFAVFDGIDRVGLGAVGEIPIRVRGEKERLFFIPRDDDGGAVFGIDVIGIVRRSDQSRIAQACRVPVHHAAHLASLTQHIQHE